MFDKNETEKAILHWTEETCKFLLFLMIFIILTKQNKNRFFTQTLMNDRITALCNAVSWRECAFVCGYAEALAQLLRVDEDHNNVSHTKPVKRLTISYAVLTCCSFFFFWLVRILLLCFFVVDRNFFVSKRMNKTFFISFLNFFFFIFPTVAIATNNNIYIKNK